MSLEAAEKIGFVGICDRASAWILGEEEVPPQAAFAMMGYDYSDLETGINAQQHMAESSERVNYIRNFGFSIPCVEALDELAKLEPLLEVGAGTGMWSLLLKRRGVDVWSTDKNVGDSGYYLTAGCYDLDERIDGIAAARKYPHLNIFCSWPPRDSWLATVIEEMDSGISIAHIADRDCCANERFYQILKSDFEEIETGVIIPQFRGLHDEFQVWKKL